MNNAHHTGKLISEYVEYKTNLKKSRLLPIVPTYGNIDKIFQLLQNESKNILNLKIVGETVPDKIFSIITHPYLYNGPTSFATDYKKEFIKKINSKITIGEPIILTILGFPFKIPNPLKTNTNLPDLGELYFLNRLNSICALIKSFYTPGAVFYVCIEGYEFRNFIGIDSSTVKEYNSGLDCLKSQFNLDHIKFIELSSLTTSLKGFNKSFSNLFKDLKDKYNKSDPETILKVNKVYQVLKNSVNLTNSNIRYAIDIYSTPNLSPTFNKRIIISSIKYIAYHEARKNLNLMNQFFPNSLTCTVAPKPNTIGIIPISKSVKLLPYHGIPILTQKSKLKLEYFIDASQHTLKGVEIRKFTKLPLSTYFYYVEDQERK